MDFFMYGMNCSTYFIEIQYGGPPQTFSSSYHLHSYWSIIKLSVRKVMSGIFHVSGKPFHRFCLNSVWEFITVIFHFTIPIFK